MFCAGGWLRVTLGLAGLLVGSVWYVLSAGLCYAESLTSNDLIDQAAQHDGRMIIYRGEVIGDVMARGAYAWMNVYDGKNSIGCWVPVELTRNIGYTGNYKVQGDQVEVIGVFNRACALHGGDLDIHGQVVRMVTQGQAQLEIPSPKKMYLALLLLGLLCLVLIWSQLKRKPARK